MGTVKTNEANNNIENVSKFSAVWCDIDDCKELGIPGEEFYTELKNSEAISAFNRSSLNGIQLFWRLDKPWNLKGDKNRFTEHLAGLLYDICYYYGGDYRVVTAHRLMRLPGSLNLKPEYISDPFMAKSRMTDQKFTLDELKKRFVPDPDLVPRLISYACTRTLTEIWEKGDRHFIILQLAGSARKHGVNKEACRRLCKEVQKFFGDTEDRSANIDSTYEAELDSVATLHTDYAGVADAVERAIDVWVKQKIVYCKKRGFDFFPENINPLESKKGDDTFYERGLQTYYAGKDKEELFSNFVIKLNGRIIRAATNSSSWLAEICMEGELPTRIEISTEKHSQWQKFLTIPEVPVGTMVTAPKMWAEYIAYLQTTCPDYVVKESTYYGWVDIDKGTPSLLLPGVPHENYVWTGREDTAASPHILRQEIPFDDVTAYLKKFIDYYATYHEPTFIWPALGWFASCSVKELIRRRCNGFPTLAIKGLSGAGKSYLIEGVLGMHYGCQHPHDFDTTSIVAIRTWLSSNNICPVIIDEFRQYQGSREPKTVEMVNMIRGLHDGFQSSRGMSNGSGGLTKSVFQTPLCLVGEHGFIDPASVNRSLIIALNRSWINKYHALSEIEQNKLDVKRAWLHDTNHQGWLGSILISWAGNHAQEIAEIIERAEEWVKETCPTVEDRKRTGCTANIVGHMILAQIYREHSLTYPLKKHEILDYLYSCDPTLKTEQSDSATIQHLFEVTDGVIIDAHRARMSHENTLYVYDINDNDFIFVDISRWYRLIKPHIRVSESATLTDQAAFISLIQDHHTHGDSPFVEFTANHPVLGKCVKIDIRKVQTAFGINTAQWRGIHDFEAI
jgi:hypothetical protein